MQRGFDRRDKRVWPVPGDDQPVIPAVPRTPIQRRPPGKPEFGIAIEQGNLLRKLVDRPGIVGIDICEQIRVCARHAEIAGRADAAIGVIGMRVKANAIRMFARPALRLFITAVA